MVASRSGKNTHISRIGNSVPHLRSYTNTAIAGIAGNSALGTDITAQSDNIVMPSTDIVVLSADIAASSAALVQVFHDISLNECFVMFY